MRALGKFLRNLHHYAFALTFGGSVVASLFFALALVLLAFGIWPADVAPQRVSALMWMGLSSQLIVLLVIFTWSSGRIDNLKFSGFGAEASIDFADNSDQSTEVPIPDELK